MKNGGESKRWKRTTTHVPTSRSNYSCFYQSKFFSTASPLKSSQWQIDGKERKVSNSKNRSRNSASPLLSASRRKEESKQSIREWFITLLGSLGILWYFPSRVNNPFPDVSSIILAEDLTIYSSNTLKRTFLQPFLLNWWRICHLGIIYCYFNS